MRAAVARPWARFAESLASRAIRGTNERCMTHRFVTRRQRILGPSLLGYALVLPALIIT
ncbi:hypothetical protein LA76x_0590 [Lysobacter antibioticus]|uniref:Uncharacterized protein n=1 Tax=Lysobacter antibioticus TaxID=84531 RepID=A0A0S2F5D6_LYSAN|nr:hypothetical protein LA76x_0590 [Lysobacter antibioticus]